jgi:CRISPR-associated protein (TIGR02584 family)
MTALADAASLRTACARPRHAISAPMSPYPDDPTSYPRRILLAVTGLSPQVVTETLYALAVEQTPPFIPTRIEVLTTEEGRQRALLQLLDPDRGAFPAFCREFDLDALAPAFDPAAIGVIESANGPLADIQSVDDNRCAADAIVERIRMLTSDPETALHVSIAGGRKTMGFLAGHALSLFGRPQDRLSHVLVAESFTTHSEFFFPPKRRRVLYDRMNRPVRTDQAQLVLADIPFLRLRGQLPETLLADGRSYSDTVAEAQAAFDPVLEIDLPQRCARFGGRPVKLPPVEFAWLAWHAQRRRRAELPHGGATRWTETDPAEFGALYRSIAPDTERADQVSQRIARLARSGNEKEWFEQHTAKLNKLLKQKLGFGAAPYLLRSSGRRPFSRTGLTLPPERIRWIE